MSAFFIKEINVFGNMFGILFDFDSRIDSNVCVIKAALKRARSGSGVLLKHGNGGKGKNCCHI